MIVARFSRHPLVAYRLGEAQDQRRQRHEEQGRRHVPAPPRLAWARPTSSRSRLVNRTRRGAAAGGRPRTHIPASAATPTRSHRRQGDEERHGRAPTTRRAWIRRRCASRSGRWASKRTRSSEPVAVGAQHEVVGADRGQRGGGRRPPATGPRRRSARASGRRWSAPPARRRSRGRPGRASPTSGSSSSRGSTTSIASISWRAATRAAAVRSQSVRAEEVGDHHGQAPAPRRDGPGGPGPRPGRRPAPSPRGAASSRCSSAMQVGAAGPRRHGRRRPRRSSR